MQWCNFTKIFLALENFWLKIQLLSIPSKIICKTLQKLEYLKQRTKLPEDIKPFQVDVLYWRCFEHHSKIYLLSKSSLHSSSSPPFLSSLYPLCQNQSCLFFEVGWSEGWWLNRQEGNQRTSTNPAIQCKAIWSFLYKESKNFN